VYFAYRDKKVVGVSLCRFRAASREANLP
jgi:hypothetical protein